MEDPSSPECTAAARCDHGRESIRDGIGVDGEWEHQRVREDPSQCGSVGTCMLFVLGPYPWLSLMT